MSAEIEAELRAAFEAASQCAAPRADLCHRVRRAARRRRRRGVAAALTVTVIVAGAAYLASSSTTAPPARPSPSSPHRAGPVGSPGNPLVVSCDAEAWPAPPDPPMPATPGPQDLAIGPVYFPAGRALATQTPARYGYTPFGRDGRFYKLALVVRPGATVTVTIGASARGHAVIDAPGAAQFGLDGVTSATYHACRQAGGAFAQGFAFTRPPLRGCVPLDVTAGGQPPVRHLTLSLFAGSCPA